MGTPWGRVRQGYMAGKSYKELAQKYHVSVKTIQNKASKEGWVKEKGKIQEEIGQKIHERVVRVRVAELEKLMEANGKLIDALVELSNRASGDELNKMMFDKAGTMKNVECLSRAIATAVQTQRDLFRIPTLDQEMKAEAATGGMLINAMKLDLDKAKFEAEKAKTQNEAEADQEVWKIVAPDGEVIDG